MVKFCSLNASYSWPGLICFVDVSWVMGWICWWIMSGKYAQGRSLPVWRIRYDTSLLSILIILLFTKKLACMTGVVLLVWSDHRPQEYCWKGDAIIIIFSKEENHEVKFPWFSTCNHLHAKQLKRSKLSCIIKTNKSVNCIACSVQSFLWIWVIWRIFTSAPLHMV